MPSKGSLRSDVAASPDDATPDAGTTPDTANGRGPAAPVPDDGGGGDGRTRPAGGDDDAGRPGVSRRTTWALLAATVVPFVASAIAVFAGVGGTYRPYADVALTELIVRDVGHYEVLVGPYSRDGWHHPGPALFYVLAVPYRLLGSSAAAMSAGALLVNAASIAGMAVIAKRRGGTPFLLCLLVTLGLMVRSLGFGFLATAWNPYITVLPYGLLVMLVWAMACGERWALPVGVVVASFVVQTHVGYVALALPLLGLGAAWLVVDTLWSARRARRAGLEPPPGPGVGPGDDLAAGRLAATGPDPDGIGRSAGGSPVGAGSGPATVTSLPAAAGTSSTADADEAAPGATASPGATALPGETVAPGVTASPADTASLGETVAPDAVVVPGAAGRPPAGVSGTPVVAGGRAGGWRGSAGARLVGAGLLAGVLGALAWVLPLVEMRRPGDGNLVLVARWFHDHGGEARTLADGWRVVSAQYGLSAEWLFGWADRNMLEEPVYTEDPVVPVLLLVVAAAVVLGWRRLGTDARKLVAVWLVASVVGVIATARTLGALYAYRLAWTWTLGAVAGAYVLWVGWTFVAARWPARERRVLVPVALAAVATLAVVDTVVAAQAGTPEPEVSTVIDELRSEAYEALPEGDGEVVLSPTSFLTLGYGVGFALQLEEDGVDIGFRVGGQLSAHRAPGGAPLRAELVMAADGDILTQMELRPELQVVAQVGEISFAELEADLAERAAIEERIRAEGPGALVEPSPALAEDLDRLEELAPAGTLIALLMATPAPPPPPAPAG